MDINKMKLGLMYMFSENDKLTKQAKLQLVNFIEQANEHQLKVLAMDGELVPVSKLDEHTRQIIDDRFESFSEIGIIGVAAILTMASVLGAKKRRAAILRHQQGCATKSGQAKMICFQNAQLRGFKEEIGVYKSQIGKCSQTKNPEKCKTSLNKRVERIRAKIAKMGKKAKY